jgi:hypothetical protein
MVGLGLFASGATATAVMTADRNVKHKVHDPEDEHLSRPVRDAYKRQTPEPVENNNNTNKNRNRNIIEYMNAPDKPKKSKWAHNIDTGPKKDPYAVPRRSSQPGTGGVEEPGTGALANPAKTGGAKHGNNRVAPEGHHHNGGIHREIRPKDITGTPYRDGNEVENGTYDVYEAETGPAGRPDRYRGGGGGGGLVDDVAPEPINKREESWVKRLGNSLIANKLNFLRDSSEEARIRRRASLAVSK